MTCGRSRRGCRKLPEWASSQRWRHRSRHYWRYRTRTAPVVDKSGAERHASIPGDRAARCTQAARCWQGESYVRHSRRDPAHSEHHRTYDVLIITLGETTSVYRGTRGSWRCVGGCNEHFKVWLRFCGYWLSPLVFVTKYPVNILLHFITTLADGNMSPHQVSISVAVSAEISLRSRRKLFIIIIQKYRSWI